MASVHQGTEAGHYSGASCSLPRDKALSVLNDLTWMHRPLRIPFTGGFSATLAEALLTTLILAALLLTGGGGDGDSGDSGDDSGGDDSRRRRMDSDSGDDDDLGYGGVTTRFMALVLLLAARNNILTVLFGCSYERLLKFHRWLGMAMAFPLFYHAHYHNEGWFSLSFDGEYYLTGNAALIVYIGFFLLAIPPVRRLFFELFYISHLVLTWLFVILAVLHTGQTASAVAFSVVLLAIDCVIRFIRAHTSASIERVMVLDDDVVVLEAKWSAADRVHGYEAGSYAFLNFPSISWLEWHPISVTSSPDGSGIVRFHIKGLGGWSKALVLLRAQRDPIRINGPYGHPAVPYELHDSIALFGAGIGVTPLMSVFLDLLGRAERTQNHNSAATTTTTTTTITTNTNTTGSKITRGDVREVTLYWTVPQVSCLQWFASDLARIQRVNKLGSGCGCTFRLEVYVTKDGDAAAVSEKAATLLKMVNIANNGVDEALTGTVAAAGGGAGGGGAGGGGGGGGGGAGTDGAVWDDAGVAVHVGRPSPKALLALQGERARADKVSKGIKRVAVMACGPQRFMQAVAAGCTGHACGNGVSFHTHSETFEF